MKFCSLPHAISKTQAIVVGVFFLGFVVVCFLLRIPLVVPLLVFFLGAHLFFLKKARPRLFIHLSLLLVLLLLAAQVFEAHSRSSFAYLPIAAVGMLTMLLFGDEEISFVMAFLASFLAGIILNFNLNDVIIFFLGGLAGIYKVRDARNRGVLIEAGILVALIQVIVAFLVNPMINLKVLESVYQPLAINGLISALVVIATLKIFETLFGQITNFTLLELSDSSHPLLKRMMKEAPGSYHHSLIVSNISEAAAEAIGAHSLLVRVGAHFHDIGKMVHPEYFTENQMLIENKHDNLEPSLSRLIILNHIKEGIELGRKSRLNERVIDFIPQHHGTSTIHYFYQRALAQGQLEGLEENDYRYPGPKPQSKETAIVLLADSVEAATRVLEEHTPGRITDVVRKVINNKFIDGQLDECNLTLREIDIIASKFSAVLSAMYHGRVKYPDYSHENQNKESPKEGPHSSKHHSQGLEGGPA